jgi:hypothetical protein
VSAPGSTAALNPDPVASTVPFEPQREVRFAVVMYGGVSLAIYINGVAQELLNIVRATAPSAADGEKALVGASKDELRGAMGVYRKLGQYLDNRAKLEQAAKPGSDGKPHYRGRRLDDQAFQHRGRHLSRNSC